MANNINANNKRIAKNTLFLYFRTILVMVVSLYTSRVVLDTLGITDYGIYNVVGGVVAMFGMVSSSLSSAISRFITFELGRGNTNKLRRIFSTSINIQLGISLIVVVLGETLGLWFLNHKMNIPTERMPAANWVLHCSLLTFAINLISIPYNAAIIAHERMSVFAYVSLLEVTLKLAVTYLLYVSLWDKLIFYSLLLVAVALCIRLVYGAYCSRHFEETKYEFFHDHSLVKEMAGFAGWNFIGSSSALLRDQGGNIVINLFCGPAVNAARGVATHVNSAIHSFVSNFMTALNPQITKSYAVGNSAYMMQLIFQGARLSFYLLLLLSLPVIINAPFILSLWLKTVPDHTVQFVRLVLLFAMSESISHPLITAMQATGRIRNYQIVVGGLQMMNLPVSYILLRMGCIPEAVLYVAIAISQCCLVARLYMLRGMIKLQVRKYLKEVYCNVCMVAFCSALIPYLLSDRLPVTFATFMLNIAVSLFCTVTVVYLIGCNRGERRFIQAKIQGSWFLRSPKIH